MEDKDNNKKDLINIDDLTLEEENSILNQILTKRQQRLEEKQRRLEEETKAKIYEIEKNNIELKETVNAQNETIKAVVDTSARRIRNLDKFWALTAIGGNIYGGISAIRMGKLVVAMGLAKMVTDKKYLKRCTPKREYIGKEKGEKELASYKPQAEYTTYIWHVDRLGKEINKFLEKHDMYIEFWNGDIKKREAIIDMLYDELA